MNSSEEKSLIDWFIISYYLVLIVAGISQILYLPIPIIYSLVNFLFAWFIVPLATLAIIGMFINNKTGLKIILGVQFLILLIVGFDSVILLLNSDQVGRFGPQQMITILNLVLNFGILIFLFKRFKTLASSQPVVQAQPTQIPPETVTPSSPSSFKSLFQIVLVGLTTGIGWTSAVNWTWLRFFTDSPTAIERFSPGYGGIGTLTIKLVPGLVGVLVASLVYVWLLSRQKRINLKKGVSLAIPVSILLTFPLLVLLISPQFLFLPFINLPFIYFYGFFLSPLIDCPCIVTPTYESFTPILPSLFLVLSLNLLPVLLSYFLIARKRFVLIVGIILIVISGAYFETTFLLSSSKSGAKTGDAQSSVNFEVYKPTYLPLGLELTGNASSGRPFDYFILELTQFRSLRNRIIQRPAKKQIDDYSALASTYTFTTPEELLSKKEQGTLDAALYPIVKKVQIKDNEAGIFVQVACSYPDSQKVCSQILEFVHFNTRIGIDLDYIGADQEPLSEEELIKVARSMEKSDEILNYKPRKYFVKFDVFRPSYLPAGVELDVNEGSGPDAIWLYPIKSEERIGQIVQRPSDKQVEYFWNLPSSPQEMLANEATIDKTRYPLIKTVAIDGETGILIHVNCKTQSDKLCSQILEWVHQNTRIGIDLYGIDKLQAPFSEDELIKIGQSMEQQ